MTHPHHPAKQRTHRLRIVARDWLARTWCGWLHGGGDIKRDQLGRINWQCRKCGRWSDPISHADEAAMTDAAIKAAPTHPKE